MQIYSAYFQNQPKYGYIVLEARISLSPSISFSLLPILEGVFKYLRNRWQFCRDVMAREARSIRGTIFELEKVQGSRGKKKEGTAEGRREESKRRLRA